MADTIIKNGTIITATQTYKADICIADGKILEISEDLGRDAHNVVDAAGLYVLPGAIDAHVHLETPVANAVSADSCETGTRAAACGGVTTVFDFSVQAKGQGLLDDAKDRIARFAPQACVDFGLHISATDMEHMTEEEVLKAADFGITSYKLYMVYKNLMVDDGMLFEMLEISRKTGTLVAVHAENPAIIDRRIKKLLEEEKTSAWHHYESRPEFVEAEAIKRAIHLAKAAGSRLYIVHLACREGMEEVARARREGYGIIAETCPQYLHFTNEVYKRADGRNFVCSPPVKGPDSREALWEGVKWGNISTIATDHCPFQSWEKDYGKDDFTKIPNGCMGTETMFPFMLGEANKGRISFRRAVELCCTNPAKVFGCASEKGTIAAGSDADIVLYDPEKRFTVSKDNMHSNVDYTIWEGYEMKGYPVMTFLRGQLVYEDGQFKGKPGSGRFVRCRVDK
jgi:dihydropyrimidinase